MTGAGATYAALVLSPQAGSVRGVRVLGPSDLDRTRRLLDRDPVTHVFVADRVETTRLDPRWLGGRVYGFVEDGRLTAACHHAANLVPVDAHSDAVQAFAERALEDGRSCASLFGPQDEVLAMWEVLSPSWGPARSLRPDQPFMVVTQPPAVLHDPHVRRVRMDEIDVLYPASVAMFLEEVGVSPEENGPEVYRARVASLIAQGRVFARIEDGRVLFKAEIGSRTAQACQLQGVYVDREHRGRGLGTAGVATVVHAVLAEGMPAITLYVNADNEPAQRAYQRAGFRRTRLFASVLL
jgi:predicted GNAT family acetyltransferase